MLCDNSEIMNDENGGGGGTLGASSCEEVAMGNVVEPEVEKLEEDLGDYISKISYI